MPILERPLELVALDITVLRVGNLRRLEVNVCWLLGAKFFIGHCEKKFGEGGRTWRRTSGDFIRKIGASGVCDLPLSVPWCNRA